MYVFKLIIILNLSIRLLHFYCASVIINHLFNNSNFLLLPFQICCLSVFEYRSDCFLWQVCHLSKIKQLPILEPMVILKVFSFFKSSQTFFILNLSFVLLQIYFAQTYNCLSLPIYNFTISTFRLVMIKVGWISVLKGLQACFFCYRYIAPTRLLRLKSFVLRETSRSSLTFIFYFPLDRSRMFTLSVSLFFIIFNLLVFFYL